MLYLILGRYILMRLGLVLVITLDKGWFRWVLLFEGFKHFIFIIKNADNHKSKRLLSNMFIM